MGFFPIPVYEGGCTLCDAGKEVGVRVGLTCVMGIAIAFFFIQMQYQMLQVRQIRSNHSLAIPIRELKY